MNKEKQCGFEYKECTEKCKYFNTCARNPHRKVATSKKRRVTTLHHRQDRLF